MRWSIFSSVASSGLFTIAAVWRWTNVFRLWPFDATSITSRFPGVVFLDTPDGLHWVRRNCIVGVARWGQFQYVLRLPTGNPGARCQRARKRERFRLFGSEGVVALPTEKLAASLQVIAGELSRLFQDLNRVAGFELKQPAVHWFPDELAQRVVPSPCGARRACLEFAPASESYTRICQTLSW